MLQILYFPIVFISLIIEPLNPFNSLFKCVNLIYFMRIMIVSMQLVQIHFESNIVLELLHLLSVLLDQSFISPRKFLIFRSQFQDCTVG
jgi:hypothetical protein